MKLDAVVIGLLNIDLIIRGKAPKDFNELIKWTGETEIHCLTAGAVGYFIQNLSRLGIKTGIITSMGDDGFGLIIKKTLQEARVDISRLKIQKGTQSAIAVYVLLFGSNKRPMPFRMMTHDPLPKSFSDEDLEYIFKARLLHYGGYLHFPQPKLTSELFNEVKDQGLTITMDPQFPLKHLEKPWIKAFDDILNYVDILLIDENEALGLTNARNINDAVTKLLDAGPKIIAIKLGEKGCMVCNQDERIRKPAIPIENIVDTIGAGDAFDSGFITGFLEGLSLEKMTDLALQVANYSLKGVGGSNMVPPRNEIILD